MARLAALVVLGAAVALPTAAPGARADSADHCRTEASAGAQSSVANPAGGGDLEFRVRYAADPGELPRARWVLTLRNRTRKVLTLSFPTSQYADVVVRRGSSVRYRWSSGRVFFQAIRSRSLRPRETYVCTLGPDPLALAPGAYTVTASLNTFRPRVLARRSLLVPRLMQ